MSGYEDIQPGGGSTGATLNLQRRIDLITKHTDLKDKHILDCGCGRGDYVLKFLQFSPHVQGIEYEEENVKAFKLNGIHPGCVQRGDIEHLSFADASFDLVLLNEVLEHVPNDARALEEVYRVLKPGGFLAVFSPNRLYPFETHGVTCKLTARRIPHYVPLIPYIPLRFGKLFLEYHARNYTPWELRRMITAREFKIVEQTAIWQTFENISGNSPRILQILSPLFRALSFTLEKIPLIRFFGVSQVAFARK